MRRKTQLTFLILLLFAGGIVSATAQDKPNVLLICVDDLRPELGCYGVDYIRSPNIDQLAAEGTLFTQHYVQAPTCGASRYAMLTGCYGPAGNGALFERARKIAKGESFPPSMPAWFRQHGYRTVSVGKVSHHPGGRGGDDWSDDSKLEMPAAWDLAVEPSGDWQHPRGWMHGLANGEIRKSPKDMDVFQSTAGEDSIYPDGLGLAQALQQIEQIGRLKQNDGVTKPNEQPFFLAVGVLRPHLPLGAPAKYMEFYRDVELPAVPHPRRPAHRTTWHKSGEFMGYNRWGRDPNVDPEFATDVRKHYAACVTFADAMVGRIVDGLKANGEWENTIVVLWGDHGWHLGEHGVWGKHTLFEESLRAPLIIKSPDLESGTVDMIVESIDLFPTLCAAAGLEVPEGLDGTSLQKKTALPAEQATTCHAISYHRKVRTIRSNDFRLIKHADEYVELYDKRENDFSNLADDQPKIVERLLGELEKAIAQEN